MSAARRAWVDAVAPGDQFGRWTVLARITPIVGKRSMVRVRCGCGLVAVRRLQHLLDGISASCGCALRRELAGQRIGRLTVIARAPRIRQGGRSLTTWIVRCDCGRTIRETTMNLTRPRGPIRSCGCEYLKPAVTLPAAPTAPRTTGTGRAVAAPRQTAPDVPLASWTRANGNGDGDGTHLSQLGRTRTITPRVGEDRHNGTVLADGDPFTFTD
jgi:hypothetical protein